MTPTQVYHPDTNSDAILPSSAPNLKSEATNFKQLELGMNSIEWREREIMT